MDQETLRTAPTLFIDVETSGFIQKAKTFDDPTQAWPCQLGFVFGNANVIAAEANLMINAMFANHRTGYDTIIREQHPEAVAIHGIKTESTLIAPTENFIFSQVFWHYFSLSRIIVAHNYSFDSQFIYQAFQRSRGEGDAKLFLSKPHIDTKKYGTDMCGLLTSNGRRKPPKLIELYQELFQADFPQTHGALSDALALRYCYYAMIDRGCFEEVSW